MILSKRHLFFSVLTTAIIVAVSCEEKSGEVIHVPQLTNQYFNPVITYAPDPSVLDDRDRTGYFYAYSTQTGGDHRATPYMPVWRSKDFVKWEKIGDAFNTKPDWVPDSRMWAPDINYINGKYVLYYALGVWDGINSSSGVAVSDTPRGPFRDLGMLVSLSNTGVSNSIDPNYFDDGDAKYLFWGSFGQNSGIWAIQLSDDGLSIREGAEKVRIGNTNMEGTYVHKHDGKYYLFGSMGSCCSGEESTYHIIVARADNVLGPYKSPSGQLLTDENYNYTIMQGTPDKRYVGTGHNAEIITDDSGQEWMPYHSFWKGGNYSGRGMNIDKIGWKDGWPYFQYGHPTTTGSGPFWNTH